MDQKFTKKEIIVDRKKIWIIGVQNVYQILKKRRKYVGEGLRYHSNLLNVVGIEQKERKKKERSIMVIGLPISTASTKEAKQKVDENKISNLLNSLGLGDDFSRQIEKVHRFKAPNETGKIAPIRVTIKLIGPSSYMYNAT